MGNITNKSRDILIDAIGTQLDTRDKRFMFLKIHFPKSVNRIQLEGSAHETACEIFFEFEKRDMIGSLIASLNSIFELNLNLITNE